MVFLSKSLRGVEIPRFLGVAVLAAATWIATIGEADARRRHRKSYYSPPYAAFVIDAKTGRVMHAQNADAERYPASITKVMTLYLLFEDLERGRYNLNSQLRISANAARQAPSKLGLPAGETISVEDAIKALINKSANDIAVAVAENLAGSEEAFAERMTRKAHALGMKNTTFVNASGLPNAEQVTTARDLARLGIAIQSRFPKYYHYFGQRGFEFEGTYFRNHNRLLGRVAAVDGIKTGYTRSSGFNLLTSARAEGRHLVAVVLGGRSGRARDNIMAHLVNQHLPRAYAGRRTGVVVATADDDDDDSASVRRRETVARTAPLPPAPAPTLRAPTLTATAQAVGNITPPPRPVGETTDLRNVRPAVATAKSSPVTPGAPLALHAPASPPRPEAPIPPGAKATHRLTPPADIGARPLSFTGSPDRRGPRPPLDLSPTGSLKVEPDDSNEDATPDEETSKKKVASPSKPLPEAPKAKPAAPSAPMTADAARPAQGGWVIQLGATEDKAKALEILERARQRSQTLLAKAKPFTEPVEKGGTTLWRARFAGFEEQDAQAACRALKRSGFACFATKA